jgi:poly(A) polymerase
MMEGEAAISHIHPIASAFTPVLKFTIHNIHFDMLFGRASGKANVEKLVHYQRLSICPLASMDTSISRKAGPLGIATHAESARAQASLVNTNTTTTTTTTIINTQSKDTKAGTLHEFTIEDSFLTGMEDDSEVRSANGVRVTQFIMDYVPNQDVFRLVLCAVKEWAMLHGIYSNVLGFLGGVNWAIMVAHLCKRYPTQQPSHLLRIFFKFFSTWKWPRPVMLGYNDDKNKNPYDVAGGMRPWDPKTNPRDARHVMPIITPVSPRSEFVTILLVDWFPNYCVRSFLYFTNLLCSILYLFPFLYATVNSTYNIAIPQQRRIQEELIRAAILMQDESNWRSLYNRSDFFERHSNFLKITIRAGNNPGEFTKWLRLCESRLRLLVNALDCPEMSVWPFAQLMEQRSKPTSMEATPEKTNTGSTLPEALFFIALRFAPNVESIDLKHRTSEFLINQINSWEGRKPDMDFMIHHVLQKDLPHHLIDEYVATKPSAYQIPNPMPFKPATHETKTHKEKNVGAVATTATASTKPGRSDGPSVPKDIQGPGGGDTQSVARSTNSSIARSMNSSMQSVDGTEISIDGIEPESRPLSPLGNFITVEGGPSTNKKEQIVQGDTASGRDDDDDDDDAKPHTRQLHLYEYLTGKIDDILPVSSADESGAQSIAAESQSDQSSTRSPIKKRARNNSRA